MSYSALRIVPFFLVVAAAVAVAKTKPAPDPAPATPVGFTVDEKANAQLTKKMNIPVYFADPRSPWQRGSNENTNGLLRQWFPKGTDLSQYSQRELDKYAALLNGRPRMTLGWKNPAQAFEALLP